MYFPKIAFFFLCFFLILTGCTPEKTPPSPPPLNGEQSFIEWAKKNALSFDPKINALPDSLLQKIAADVADSRVVVLSEGFHNCEEMLTLQYALISYLVKEKGFNTIATESGLPESKPLNDYIHGKDSIPNLWEKSIDIIYSEWDMGRKTIEWLRTFNRTSSRKVDYFGADIGGFYNNWAIPFEQIFAYTDAVDAPIAKQLRKDMAFYWKFMTKWAAYHYTTKLTAEQQNNLVVLLDNLIQTFASNKERYISKSSKKEYQWILQCIKSMRMAENYYRNYQQIKDTSEHFVSNYVGLNGREVAMAENIKWILKNKADAKIIVVNHVVHTKTASQYQGDFYRNFTPMGQLLKQHLKDSLYVIGMTYGKGSFWNKWQGRINRFVDTIPTPAHNNLEHILQAVADTSYYIRWENTPKESYNWFKETNTIRENDYEIKIKPSEWNACFYLHKVSPAKAF